MKIVVIGGSGLIGSKLVNLLREDGQNVMSASLANGVNTLTGEGLDAALAGAQVVVDVTNSPSFEDNAVMDFFQTSGRNIIAAEKKAGVKHHVALSIVGADRVPDSGYLRAKVAQEKLIRESGMPYTILRSTQFFEFLRGIIDAATIDQTVHLSTALFQPIASDDVVAVLADVTLDPPVNGIREVAGPERISFAELAKRYLSETGDTRKVVGDANARYFGAVLNDQTLTAGANARIGAQNFETWLSKTKLKA
ncbi:MAG: NAD(P)H-binding protein [Chloroflexi bacterium]|nr:NAD(P)H-binding protein [Chloroflexota bacterium]